MRRILWAAILVPLLIVAAAAAVIASVNISGNVKIINASLAVNPSTIGWTTLCPSCLVGGNRTDSASFALTNTGQIPLTLSYTASCTPIPQSGTFTVTLGQGNTSLNGVLLAAGSTISAVNATLFVSGTPASNTYTCGVTINGSA